MSSEGISQDDTGGGDRESVSSSVTSQKITDTPEDKEAEKQNTIKNQNSDENLVQKQSESSLKDNFGKTAGIAGKTPISYQKDTNTSTQGKMRCSNSLGDRVNNAQEIGKWKNQAKSTTASKLEDQMNFEHLKKLEEIFQEADADGGGGLDIDEFREAMKRTMGSEVDDKELEIIFMKVDTNCDGTVDWDEYLSYMLLEYQEKDTMTSLIKEVPFPKKIKELQSYHRDPVVRINFFQHLANKHGNKASNRDNPGGKFVILSKEGQLGFYGLDCELIKSINVDSCRESFVGQWLTDMVPLSNVGMLAISSTEREISFYDINSNKFEKQFQITGLRDPVLTMDFWFDYDNLNHCTLVAGDATGSIIVIKFVEALHRGLFGVYPQKGIVTRIPFFQLMTQKVKGAAAMIFQEVHSNWVNCVRYYHLAQGSECFISCSSTDNDSMYLGDLSNIQFKPKWPGYSKILSNKSSYFKVRKGILALDYCKEWNVIVTGSFDGIVRTWNPFSSKATSLIKGHLTPVQHVIIISNSGQVITGGRDRMIRILELRDHSTTQVIGPRSFLRIGPLNHPLQALYHHERTKSLWIAVIQVGVLEGYEDRVKEDQMNIKSHEGAVTAVLYNKLFNQVVTGGHDSIVSVWDLNTGVKAIQFYTVKGVELTTMTFDPSGRRLITGSRNGAVKIWNFNNGACLRTLTEQTMLEVTGIVCMKQKIITAGWNKVPTVYIDSRGDNDDEFHYWAKVHEDDILCMAKYQNSNNAVVASASYDGDIFIWSLDTGHVLCRINRLESYSPLSIEGHTMKLSSTNWNRRKSIRISRSEHSTTSLDSLFKAANSTSKIDSTDDFPTYDVQSTTNIKLPPISPMKSSIETSPPQIAEQETSKPLTPSSTSRTSTPKSVKFNIPEGLSPSARFLLGDSKVSNETKIRHHMDIVTGQAHRNYWEADVSIDKLIFLESRPHEPQTATMFASGALGWVYAWSVHPQGGLLGQFVGAHHDGSTVFSMATDEKNKVLLTGDTSGYVKFWEIENYCYMKRMGSMSRQRGRNVLPQFNLDETEMRILSSRRMTKLSLAPPNLAFYFRAHSGSVSDITYIDDKNLLLTSCGDGTVRLWTISGLYVGTFGEKQPWCLDKLTKGKVPADIRRVASANTLRIFNNGYGSWKLARNILNFLSLRGGKVPQTEKTSDTEIDREQYMEVHKKFVCKTTLTAEEEIEKNYEHCLKRLKKSEVLGRSYKPKQRHRILPKIDLEMHLSNFHVHSSIPFSPLEETDAIPVPVLLQEKWRLQREIQASDIEKYRVGKAPLKTTKALSLGRRRGGKKSQLTFARTSNKIAKAVKIIRPSQ